MNADGLSKKLEISCNSKKCRNILRLDGLLPCNLCRRCYHAECCNPPVKYEIASRYSWLCSRCKYCFICRDRRYDREHTLLICEICDRAYHLECTREQYKEIPKDDWHCDFCKSCSLCSTLLTNVELEDYNNFTTEGMRVCIQCSPKRLEEKRISEGHSNQCKIVLTSLNHKNTQEYCCVCSKPILYNCSFRESRIKCSLCLQGVHMNCSEISEKRSENFEPPIWMCNNCQYLSSQFV